MNGSAVTGATSSSYTANANALGNGSHPIKVKLVDTTAYVRTDPAKLLADSVQWTVNVTGVGGVNDEQERAAHVTLSPNYPNPTTFSTRIAFSLDETADVRLTISDVLGRSVQTIFNGTAEAGNHELELWAPETGGVYFCRLEVKLSSGASITKQQTMLVVR